MKSHVAAHLLQLNHQFYESFAGPFSATRQRLQPGVRGVISAHLKPARGAKILDLGCGNGELLAELDRGGFEGTYIGLDFSAGLLQEARSIRPAKIVTHFIQADLADMSWQTPSERKMLEQQGPFDFILAFAVLHHLPGAEIRLRLLETISRLLAPQGRFIHSHWQFLNSPRLRARIQPWEAAGLSPAEVDPGDYLLDWRSGGSGLRYVHHYSEEELERLAEQAGYVPLESFYSDGEGGRLGLYQVWKKA
jgi:tRNA (uracil-5-)-methyltransferase TRM9